MRLGDFGLAIDETRERPTARVGTLDYMSPEACPGNPANISTGGRAFNARYTEHPSSCARHSKMFAAQLH